MTSRELDVYFRHILDIDGFSGADSSLNGIQVDNTGSIHKVAFAVDACAESFNKAKDVCAGMLFVHHGLFWGAVQSVSGILRERLRLLLDNNIALYAAHLPLDENAVVGHNAELARRAGILEPQRFGLYHNKKIGFKGTLETPLTVHEAAERIAFNGHPPLSILPFGKERNYTCAVISGGGASEITQAIEENIDLYITGEPAHSVYHLALEGNLNMIAGGHYATEVWGLQALAKRCEEDLHIQTEFIDIPTGL